MNFHVRQPNNISSIPTLQPLLQPSQLGKNEAILLELQLRGTQFSLEIWRSIFLISISVKFLLYYHCIYTGPVSYQVGTDHHQAIQFLCCVYNHYYIPAISTYSHPAYLAKPPSLAHPAGTPGRSLRPRPGRPGTCREAQCTINREIRAKGRGL
jgi:hypothetical protein